MRSETTIARKGDKYFRQNRVWLRHLGWEPIEVTEEDDLGNLGVSSVLVMPNVYWIEAATAAQLAGFVEGGGGLIFIDGPVKSMGNEAIRAVTGMRGSVRYFEGEKMVLAVGESELIPDGGPAVDLRAREGIISHWNDFREAGVSALVEDVYQRVKAVRPEVQVSAAVLRCENSALSKFQNWYNWLAGGYIDFVVPMAYVSEVSSLEGVVDEWRTKGDLERTAAGLGVKDFGGDGAMKTPEQLLEEIELIQGRGIDGVVLFDFENLSDEQLEALATGPFAP